MIIEQLITYMGFEGERSSIYNGGSVWNWRNHDELKKEENQRRVFDMHNHIW